MAMLYKCMGVFLLCVLNMSQLGMMARRNNNEYDNGEPAGRQTGTQGNT